MDRYIIFKQTGTHADVLAAIGAADVLRHLEPRMVEYEDRFEVQFRRRLLPSDLDAVDPGFSYLARPKKTPPSLPPERIVETQSAAKGQDDRMPRATAAENRMYSILGRMKAFGGPNQIVSRFARMRRDEWSARVWDGFNGASGFVCSSPLVQLFNPHAAKGYALTKPAGTNREDKTKNRWAEPFLEWLRFRGYFEGIAGWFASGDLRLFCPIPADLPYAQFAGMAAAFRDLRLGGTGALKIIGRFPQFQIGAVTPILNRDPNLRMILRNRGFLAVAAAVRGATVGAQAARNNGKPSHREIRYGLLSSLRQAGLVGTQELLAAISAFVSDFNREAAKRRSVGLASSHIRNSEMDAFIALLERSDPRTAFGPLLCALASCIRSKGPAPEAERESELVQAIPA